MAKDEYGRVIQRSPTDASDPSPIIGTTKQACVPDAYKPLDEPVGPLTIIHLPKGGWVVEGYDAPALRAQHAAFTCLQDALDWMGAQLAYRGIA